MVLLIEVEGKKIPLPLAGCAVRPLLCSKWVGMEPEAAKKLWKALRRTAAQFPDLTLVEVEEAGRETVRVSIRSLSLRKPGRRLFGRADGEKDLHFPGNCAILKEK